MMPACPGLVFFFVSIEGANSSKVCVFCFVFVWGSVLWVWLGKGM